MHREIVFLFISVVYHAYKVEGGALPQIVLTYTCNNGVISVIDMSNGRYENIQVIKKTPGTGFCRRSNDTGAGLYDCIKNNTIGGKVHLLYQHEIRPNLVAGDTFDYFELTCDEDVETKHVTVKLTNLFSSTVAPAWKTVKPRHGSGTLSLSIDPTNDLHVGQVVKLTMAITGNGYTISPKACNAKKSDDAVPVKIWDCTSLADANIISDDVWTSSDSQISVSINMLAFKFIDSENVILECDAKVCPGTRSECDLDECKGPHSRKRRALNNSTSGVDIPVQYASVSMKVKDPILNRSSGLTSRWYSYFVPAFLVIGFRLYL